MKSVLKIPSRFRSSRIAQFHSLKYGQPQPETHPHLMKPGELVPGIPTHEFTIRRRKLFAKMTDGSVAILPASPELKMSHDIPYSFRQNSNFYYLCGFNEPNAVLVLEKQSAHPSTHRTYLFVPPKDEYKEKWVGPRTGVMAAKQAFGVDEVYSIEEFSPQLPYFFRESVSVYFDTTTNENVTGAVTEFLGACDRTVKVTSPKQFCNQLRATKSPYEIDLMRKAGKIAAAAVKRAMQLTRGGMMEHHLASVMEFECKLRGAQRMGYPCVVANGHHANVLHYITNEHVLRNGDLVLVDAGCEYRLYNSDITRTWPVNGKFTQAQRDIYQLVLDVNKECIEACLPGMTHSNLNKLAQDRIAAGLVKLGIIKPTGLFNNTVDEQTIHRFYPHWIGHGLGSDIHEEGMPSDLQAGNVVTVEPGIYIPNAPDIPEKYRGIGIRVEDDVFITAVRPEVLTSEVPKEIDEIEQLMEESRRKQDPIMDYILSNMAV